MFAMGFPKGAKPFKGFLKTDKSLLIQGRQKYNSHVVNLAYTYQLGSFDRSSALRWKACCVCRLLQEERLQSISPSGYI